MIASFVICILALLSFFIVIRFLIPLSHRRSVLAFQLPEQRKIGCLVLFRQAQFIPRKVVPVLFAGVAPIVVYALRALEAKRGHETAWREGARDR